MHCDRERHVAFLSERPHPNARHHVEHDRASTAARIATANCEKPTIRGKADAADAREVAVHHRRELAIAVE